MTASVRFGGRSAIIGDDIQTAHAELNDHAGDLGQRRSPGVGPATPKQRELTGATTTHPGGPAAVAPVSLRCFRGTGRTPGTPPGPNCPARTVRPACAVC